MSESYEPTTLYCANHPNVETSLRCRNCDKPICAKCAVLTPTGYKCRECVRGQQKVFNTAIWYDYVIAFMLAAVLSYIGSLIAGRIGWFIIFLSPIAGGIIAEVIRFATKRRRSKTLFQTAAAGTAIGAIALPLLGLVAFGMTNLFAFLWPAIYAFIVTSTVYYRLGGIRM
jgi:hypothetical protein